MWWFEGETACGLQSPPLRGRCRQRRQRGGKSRHPQISLTSRNHTPLCHFVTSPPQGGRLGARQSHRTARARNILAGGDGSGFVPGGSRTCGARAAGPWWWKKWIGAVARAPRVRGSRTFRARAGILTGKWSSQTLDGFVLFGLLRPNPPFPDVALAKKMPAMVATGMCQAGVWSGDGSRDRLARRVVQLAFQTPPGAWA